MIPIILSGGSGTRLWPLSRKMYPKQFLSLLHDESMLQKTLSRLDGLDHAAPVIVCNNEHRFIVAEQARQIGVEELSIILEPFGRNTAPAIAVAALHALTQAEDPLLLILSADHEITDEVSFLQSGKAGAGSGRGRQAGHLRDSADPGSHRLWLHSSWQRRA